MIYWTDEKTAQRYATRGLPPTAGDFVTMSDGTWRRVRGVGMSAEVGKETVYRIILAELATSHRLNSCDGPLPRMTDREWVELTHSTPPPRAEGRPNPTSSPEGR